MAAEAQRREEIVSLRLCDSTAAFKRRIAKLILLLPFVLPAASCPAPRQEETDFDRLHALMGANQKLVFDLQSHAGDPLEPEALRRDLATFAQRFETVTMLRPFAAAEENERLHRRARDTARLMRELEAKDWTSETRKPNFQRLT